MAVKWTILGFLVYAAMALYAGAAAAMLARRRRAGWGLYGAALAVAVAAFVLRWVQVAHVPLQSLFEVFLCLGMLMLPMTLFCRRFLGVGGEAADAILGFILLFPAAFIFKAEPQHLPPALRSFLFVPHVASYMLAYVILAKAAVPAMRCLLGLAPAREEGLAAWEPATYRMVSLGFPLLTLGLVLGAVWGKIAWGDYWNWDPKELWSLVSWLAYLGYFHVRYMFGTRYPRATSALAVAGLAAIVVTLLWVNLGRLFAGGMHSYAS